MASDQPTERQIQRGILTMAQTCFPQVFLHHSPGGAHLAGGSEARFKQMGALKGDGLRPGFPDLIAIWQGGIAFLEVKRPKTGKVSEDQHKVIEHLLGLGHRVSVVRSVDEAHSFLKGCGAPCRAELA